MGELGVGALEKEGFLRKLLGLQPDPWEAGTDLWRGWGGLGGPPGRGRLDPTGRRMFLSLWWWKL